MTFDGKPIASTVRPHKGRPVLFINDEPDTGFMFWHSKVASAPEDVARFARAGIRLFTFGASIAPAWRDAESPDFASLDSIIEELVRAAPDVLLMPHVDRGVPIVRAGEIGTAKPRSP